MKHFIFVCSLAVFCALGFLAQAQEEFVGAGSTFVYPLASKMFERYTAKTGAKINYQSIGSGGGILQLKNKTVDFGASDAFLNDKQEAEFSAPVLHIPITLGAVAITYNLPGNPELKFTPDVLADIFLGKITTWNDPRLVKLNPDASLPETSILPVHRSEGSGTTFIFTNYLSKVSSEWKEKVGFGTAVNWPAGLGAKGNEGVSGQVRQVPGSICYTELIYALNNNLPVGLVKNQKGNFIKPTIESTSLSGNVSLPDDTRTTLTDTDNAQGYPITGFSWLLVYKEQSYQGRTKEQAQALVNLIWWMVHDGQEESKPLSYAPLPSEAVRKAEKILQSITYEGKSAKLSCTLTF